MVQRDEKLLERKKKKRAKKEVGDVKRYSENGL